MVNSTVGAPIAGLFVQVPKGLRLVGREHRNMPRLPLLVVIALAAVLPPGAAQAYPRPARTLWASASLSGEPDSYSHEPTVSDDGRFVAFHTAATNIVPDDTNEQADIFVRDLEQGTTERVSVSADGGQADFNSSAPSISPDGRFVAFNSRATNLVPGDANGQWDAFLKDRLTGEIELISVASDGTQGNGISSCCYTKGIAGANARWVAFESDATTLVPGDTNGLRDVFLRDRQTATTTRVSESAAGAQGDNISATPSLTPDGRTLAFASYATNLVAGDTNGRADVFVKDLDTGAIRIASLTVEDDSPNSGSGNPSISADGRFVAFSTAASNMVPQDTNSGGNTLGIGEVFVRDLVAGRTERVSVTSQGGEISGVAGRPEISADGRYVTFQSGAANIVPGDTNASTDAFLHDRLTGATERISVRSDGSEATGGLFGASRPVPNADGSVVVFASDHPGIVPGDTGGGFDSDIFARFRGPALGVTELDASSAAEGVSVAGAVSMSGVVAASASDAAGDGNAALGADLLETSLVYRPEAEDILVRLGVSGLPGIRATNMIPTQHPTALPSVAGAPGVVYGLRFTVGGILHEVRALRAGASAAPPGAPLFALYRCETACLEIARLAGGFGTTGEEIRAAVPLSALGGAGKTLSAVRAFAGIGEAAAGMVQSLDELVLPDAPLPLPEVRLGIASEDVPAQEVVLDTPATLAAGRFSATVADTGSGARRVWARICLGTWCEMRSAPI